MSRLSQLLIDGFYSYEIRAPYKEIYSWIIDFTVENKIRYITYHAYRGDNYRLAGKLIKVVKEELCHVLKNS